MQNLITKEKIDELMKPYLEDSTLRSVCYPLGFCYYRHPDGVRKCVAGQLIPDSEYTESMEGKSCIDLPFFKSRYSLHDLHIIRELQWLHDDKSLWVHGNHKELITKIENIKDLVV